ncbi:hypothetical protein HDE_08698 [Halotydeus destructor]|nr:hypothetical protein HDE_08698 [Halotydeus destructor]
MEIPDAIFGDFVIILGDEELDLGANFEVSHEIEENEADPVIDYESLIIADPLLPQLSEADIQETLGETEIVDCDINHVIGSSLGEFEEELTSFQEDYTSFRDLSTTDELLDIYSTPYTWNYGSNDFEFSSLPNEWMEDDHEPVITIIGSEISYNTDDIPCLEASDILTDVSDGQENKTPKRRSKRKCRKLPKIQDTLCPEKYQVNYSKKNLLFVPNKDGVYLKPPYSYPSMVALALFSSNQAMSVKEMYKFFM